MKAYILKLSFQRISPLIWRRVILPADGTFNRLHETIQYVTNFQSGLTQYHSFAVEIEDYFITNNESILEEYKGKKFAGKLVKQPARMKIDSLLQKHGSFIYTYDFGDDWKIHVDLEETVEDYYFGYPTLLDGEGMAPPEDAGGPPGFELFKKVYGDPTHPDHATTVAWAESQSFLPLDINLVNERLKRVKYKKTEWDFIDHENYIVKSDRYRRVDNEPVNELPNRELIAQYAIACANLYGTIDYPKFLEIYNEQNGTNISIDELQVLFKDTSYVKQLEKSYVYVKKEALVHDAIEYSGEPELSNLLRSMAGKPFYVPEKEELLRYIDEFYYEKTSFQEQLAMKLAEDFFGGSTIMIKDEMDDLIHEIQVVQNNPREVIREFFGRFEMKDVNQMNEYAHMLTMISNSTRIWGNRGHTSMELFSMEQSHLLPLPDATSQRSENQKIGRNAPCPCGSGKKYKKCCGK